MKHIEVSVVLPVLEKWKAWVSSTPSWALERVGRSYELLFIDDGSPDGSFS